MKMGFTSMDDDSKAFSRRLSTSKISEKDSMKLHTDLTKLFLLVFMLLAAIVGGYKKSAYNKPSNLLSNSINKSLKQSFKASLEGSVSLKDSTLSTFRSRQIYSPEDGLTVLSDRRFSDQAPFDAVSAIESLHDKANLIEYDREDMYGHPTRHFSGIYKSAVNDSSIAHIFEYWIDMRNLLPVRLSIAKVERNVSTDSEGNPVSREIYLNIRYHDWR